MADGLDELLARSGLVTDAALAVARADAARSRKRLADSILDFGFVTERRFADWIAQISRTPLVEAIPEEEASALRAQIPMAIARELQVVPLRLVEDQLFVVMVNALDGHAIDVIQAAAGLTVRPMTGIRSDVRRAVSRLYPEEFDPSETTILPSSARPFVPETPLAASSGERAPFEFSSETLLRRPAELDFLRDPGPGSDVEFGTVISRPLPENLEHDTQPPVPAQASADPGTPGEDSTAPTNPLIEIERRLDQIVRMIHRIEERLDTLETLTRDSGERLRH
jgi:hypothetical protein